ncbi:MAG: YheU family protein [Deltaproteobacteria bacterium]
MENHHDGIIIPHDNLTEEALQGLIEEFVTREDTDGSLEENVKMVKRQLKRGDVLIVYDGDTQTANIVPKKNARIISQEEK